MSFSWFLFSILLVLFPIFIGAHISYLKGRQCGKEFSQSFIVPRWVFIEDDITFIDSDILIKEIIPFLLGSHYIILMKTTYAEMRKNQLLKTFRIIPFFNHIIIWQVK